MIYKSIIDLVGKTPVLELNKYCNKHNIASNIYVKLECFNPTGSVKDRAVFQILKDAIDSGVLKEDSTIIEATSGNTGIALACFGRYLNLKVIIVMPKSMSLERRKLIEAYGAKLVLVDGNMQCAVEKAKELNYEIKNSMILDQFNNHSNSKAHYLNTVKEILKDLPNVDIIVSGIGTGGTITGIGRYCKEEKLNIQIIGVEPKTAVHKIQGIGPGFKASILNIEYVDELIKIEDNDAIETAKEIVKTEGILVGISSGAALEAAKQISRRKENTNKKILVIFPDTGARYEWN